MFADLAVEAVRAGTERRSPAPDDRRVPGTLIQDADRVADGLPPGLTAPQRPGQGGQPKASTA